MGRFNSGRYTMRKIIITTLIPSGLMLSAVPVCAQSFQLAETSISDIHAAMQAGTLTCHDLVQQYLNRIQAYDQQGPKLNAMLYINPQALQQADAMDQEFKRTGKLKPLGCI